MEVKLTTKNMAYMAMFAAMQVVLEYCTKFYPSFRHCTQKTSNHCGSALSAVKI